MIFVFCCRSSNAVAAVAAMTERTGDAAQSPSARRIRSSPPDLDIIVGEGQNRKTYQHYRIILAHQSPFIDAKLASSMGDSSTIEFPDMPPQDWELMTQYLEIGGRPPRDLEQVFRLVVWFHKYDFPFSLKTCDEIIQEMCFDIPENLCNSFRCRDALGMLDTNIEAIAIAHQCQLQGSKEKGTKWLVQMISCRVLQSLTVEHLRTLVPVLIDSDAIWAAVSSVLGRGISMTDDRAALVQNSLFPELFVSRAKDQAWRDSCLDWMDSQKAFLQVRGAGITRANGDYRLDPSDQMCFLRYVLNFGREPIYFGIVLEENEWRIVRSGNPLPEALDSATILYRCPAERHETWPRRPPLFGWVRDSLDAGAPPIVELQVGR